MTLERVKKLNGIKFHWKKGQGQSDWEERFEQLKIYRKRFGDCNVPLMWEENKRLGEWVHRQRSQLRLKNSGGKSNMTERRRQALDSIQFTWQIRASKPKRTSWNDRLDQLKKYHERYGNFNVPMHWEENMGLGQWVHRQRYEIRLIQSGKISRNMTDEHLSILENIGFVSSVNKQKDEVLTEGIPVNNNKLKKMICEHCNRDSFETLVSFMYHEATCLLKAGES